MTYIILLMEHPLQDPPVQLARSFQWISLSRQLSSRALKPEMFANFSINFRKGKTVANEAKRPSRTFQPITPSNEVVSAQTVERYWVLSQRYLCSPYLTPRTTRSRATWEAFCSSAMRSLATRQALWA